MCRCFEGADPQNLCFCQAITGFILLQASTAISLVALFAPSWLLDNESSKSRLALGLWAKCDAGLTSCHWSGTPIQGGWLRACQVLMCASVLCWLAASWLSWTKVCSATYRRSYATNVYIIIAIILAGCFAVTVAIVFGVEGPTETKKIFPGNTSLGWTYILIVVSICSGAVSCFLYGLEGMAIKRSMRGYFEITGSGNYF